MVGVTGPSAVADFEPDRDETKGRPKGVAPNLSLRLVILTLAVLVPALAMAALLTWDAYRHERAYIERQMMETTRALSLVVDRQIGQQEVLLQALATGPLLSTLINESISRQTQFNTARWHGLSTVPQKPPEGMRFIQDGPGQPTPRNAKDMTCARRAPPVLRGALDWTGSLLFRLKAATRAGVVETVDLQVSSSTERDPRVVDYFRGVILQAVAAYQCEGDHVFEQEFQLKVE